MIFRQFRAADGELSYLFADPVTRQAAVLDAHLSLEREYLGMIHHLDLKLVFAIETHAHEAHLSAAPLLCEETGAVWIMSRRRAGIAQARPVDDGECVFMGEDCFVAMETPGHSACSMCFCWRDRVFTGHTLLAGRTGDCERSDADPARLYQSIVQRLYTLPKDTRVFPGAEYAGRRESTVRYESAHNSDLNAATSVDVFIAAKRRANGAAGAISAGSVSARPVADLFPHGKGGGL